MNHDANACEPEPSEDRDERHLVTVLSGIYLDAGLPLEAAVRSAIADYECSFGTAELCAP